MKESKDNGKSGLRHLAAWVLGVIFAEKFSAFTIFRWNLVKHLTYFANTLWTLRDLWTQIAGWQLGCGMAIIVTVRHISKQLCFQLGSGRGMSAHLQTCTKKEHWGNPRMEKNEYCYTLSQVCYTLSTCQNWRVAQSSKILHTGVFAWHFNTKMSHSSEIKHILSPKIIFYSHEGGGVCSLQIPLPCHVDL